MANVEENNKSQTSGKPNVVPDWLKAEDFEVILKETVPNYKRILNFKARSALPPGENYATVILRIEIEVELLDGKTKTTSYMMKVSHDNEMFQALLKQLKTFEKEHCMYTKIVPELEQIYREAGVEVKFGPCCYTLQAPVAKDNILLEDLRPRGFKNANRLEGLDMDHTKSVLRKLAQWHAASAVRVETKGRYELMYELGNFDESYRPALEQMMSAMSGPFLKCLKSYKGHETYSECVEKLQKNVSDELYRAARIDWNEFNVLNHGDCWSNNVMFQYDAFDNIKETYFVNYQGPKFGTLAQDLIYFLLSSTKLELKLKKFEYFIEYYHHCLKEFLTLLKYPKRLPSLRDLHMQLYRYGVLGYVTVTGIMAGALIDPTDNSNFDSLVSESEEGTKLKMLMYSNARYRKHMETILPWLHYRGALES